MEMINRKRLQDSAYYFEFKGTKVGVYAINRGSALQKAVEHFRPKKQEKDLVRQIGTQ